LPSWESPPADRIETTKTGGRNWSIGESSPARLNKEEVKIESPIPEVNVEGVGVSKTTGGRGGNSCGDTPEKGP